MDIKQVLKQGFDTFLGDVVPLSVAALLVILLTPLSLGLLGGPLAAGLYRMVLLRLRTGRAPAIGDVFYLEHFGRFVFAFYALVVLVSVGYMLLIVPGIYLTAIGLYTVPLMVDRELPFGVAWSQSKAAVDRIGLAPHFGLVLLLALGGAALGTLTRLIGSLVWLPFCVCCVAVAYHQLLKTPEAPAPALLPET